MAELGQDLLVRSEPAGQFTVLTATGRLDAATYLMLRDTIIKAALDDPRAVIVDVSDLHVPQESAWAVFTSARWHVERWPDVPILLVCAHTAGQNAAIRNGITRYVPIFPTVELACNAVMLTEPRPWRRRARLELPAHLTSLRRSRKFVSRSLTEWAMPDWIPVAQIVVTTFIENVLATHRRRRGCPARDRRHHRDRCGRGLQPRHRRASANGRSPPAGRRGWESSPRCAARGGIRPCRRERRSGR